MRLSLPLRLTPALQDANFTYGFTDTTLDAVVKYWRTKYDWKKREERLNSYPHFKYVTLNGRSVYSFNPYYYCYYYNYCYY